MKRRSIHNFLETQLSSSLFTYREIFKMLLPLILDMLFINAINMLTTSMISASGDASVAAVSLISPVTTMVLFILNALAAGGTVVVAQYKGKKDQEKILEASGHTFIITFLLAIVLCTVFILLSSPIVHLLYGNAEQVVLDKAIPYLSGVSFSIIIYSLYAGVFAIFRGLGETKLCLHLTIFINLSYFIFSFIFINLLKLDIQGTVLALILARLLGSLVSLYYLFIKRNRLLYLQPRHLFHFSLKLFHSILRISIPFGAEQIFFFGGGILVQKYMVEMGTEAMAANAIASTLFGLIYSAPLAVGNLATTIIGQCVGAGEKTLARKYTMKLVYLSTALIFCSAAVFLPFIPWLMRFYKPEVTTIPLVMRLIWIALLPMPFFYSLSNVLPYALRSAGDGVYPSIVSLLTMWIVRVGTSYILALVLGFGMEGIWICMSAEWAVRSLLLFMRYKGTKWLSKSTIEE